MFLYRSELETLPAACKLNLVGCSSNSIGVNSSGLKVSGIESLTLVHAIPSKFILNELISFGINLCFT